MAYDLYPAVDENYQFPPEVRLALSESSELRNQIVPMDSAARNNLTGAQLWDGRMVFNTTTGSIDQYDSTSQAWNILDMPAFPRVDRTRNIVPVRVLRSGKDGFGIFTTVEEYRVGSGSGLATRSVLSGGTAPMYSTRTFTEYDLDGVTVIRTTIYSLTYDGDDQLITETVA